jgi:hypothetical protein
MPYRGNPSTDVGDAVRLHIGDLSTSTSNEVFSDGEIDYFVALKPNAHLAASAAVTSLIGSTRATSLAGVLSKQVGDLRIDYGAGGVSAHEILTSKAKQLRLEGVRKVKPYAGGISDSDKRANEDDTDWDKPHFRIGQFEHALNSVLLSGVRLCVRHAARRRCHSRVVDVSVDRRLRNSRVRHRVNVQSSCRTNADTCTHVSRNRRTCTHNRLDSVNVDVRTRRAYHSERFDSRSAHVVAVVP